MADAIHIDTKQARREAFKLRGRFIKLQRFLVADALFDASEPIVASAQVDAPVLQQPKRFRQIGQLRGRIAPTLMKSRPGFVTVGIGPVRFSKNEKRFPFWGLFQEKGWWLTTHTPEARRNLSIRQVRSLGMGSKRASRRRIRFIPGKHFLKRAGEANADRAHKIFAARIFQKFAELGAAEGAVKK
jgi:hypothetical protein